MIGVIVVALAAILVAALGFRQIGEKERGAVEVFRKFHGVFGPGLRWILIGVMRVKRVPIYELMIPLFEKPIKVDFSDGWAIPIGCEAWVKMKSPDTAYSVDGDEPKSGTYRALYEIEDWRKAIRVQLENALRTYLNRFTIDEAITMRKAGFNLANHDPGLGLPNEELIEIEKSLQRWGFELIKITVGDFDVDPAAIAARSAIHQAKKGAEAGEYNAKQKAEETAGSVLLMMAKREGKSPEEMQKLLKGSPARRLEFSDLVKRQMSIGGNSLVDIRVDGAEGAEKLLMNLLAAWKRMPAGSSASQSIKEKKDSQEDWTRKEEKKVRGRAFSGPRILSKEEVDREVDSLPEGQRREKLLEIARDVMKGDVDIRYKEK